MPSRSDPVRTLPRAARLALVVALLGARAAAEERSEALDFTTGWRR